MKVYLTYRERVAGFFIIMAIALVSLFIIGAAVENLWFTPRIDYHIYVVRGDGLTKGSPVLISGVEVGKVGDMTIMNDGRIDVKLSVLEKHADRIVAGTKAETRRALGIGEKRVLLFLPEGKKRKRSKKLPPEAKIPVNEPKDILDLVSTIDLGKYMDTMDRAVESLNLLMTKLEEEDRMIRMIEAFDELGPTLSIMHKFFSEIDEPFLALIEDPSVRRAFKEGAKIFGDRKTRKLIHSVAASVDPEKARSMLIKSEMMIAKLNSMLKKDGHLQNTFKGTDKLLNDGKLDNMLTSMENLTDEEQIEKLLHNMTVLSSQMAKIGPSMPQMADELTKTMRELSVVLKAIQKTRLLNDESEEVLEEMKKRRKKD